MRVVVIGLGSMGTRRIRLLQEREDISEIIGVDSRDDRRNEAEKKYHIVTRNNISDILSFRITCAFVCTSPLSHGAIIKECLGYGMHVFTELSLVSDDYDENLKLSKEKNLVLFPSSSMRYRKEMQFIIENCKNKGKINYIYHVGQYLPDWHTWESYKDFFVGDKKTNGCREMFAIELPWIIDAFGEIVGIESVNGKLSTLEIDYPDYYFILINHCNGNKGFLAVDVVSRIARRTIDVYSEEVHILWSGTPDSLKYWNRQTGKAETVKLYSNVQHMEGFQSTIIENAYASEIGDFLSIVEGKQEQLYTLEDDKAVIHIIDQIESRY